MKTTNNNHTIPENFTKIESLVTAVHQLHIASDNLSIDVLKFQLDSLDILANESYKSLQSIKNSCKKNA